MLIIGDTIQFILGATGNVIDDSLKHFEYNTKTKKFLLIHENIHSKSVSHVTHLKLQHLFDNLKIGDEIDVKDFLND